jgi:Arc/MetJ-type ribon-helix-helix transcriptional regulator
MKSKTSVTLSESLLTEMDRHMDRFKSRSDLVEQAVVNLLNQIDREHRNARDAKLLDRHADRLNREAKDSLTYQGEV